MNASPRGHQALLRYAPAVAISLLIAALSLLPAAVFKRVSEPIPPFAGIDKLVHGLMYATLTTAFAYACPAEERGRFRIMARLAFIAMLYGLMMEICQRLFTSTRSFDLLDALANAAGAAVAAGLITLRFRSRRMRLPE